MAEDQDAVVAWHAEQLYLNQRHYFDECIMLRRSLNLFSVDQRSKTLARIGTASDFPSITPLEYDHRTDSAQRTRIIHATTTSQTHCEHGHLLLRVVVFEICSC